jgi:hypothetical protein
MRTPLLAAMALAAVAATAPAASASTRDVIHGGCFAVLVDIPEITNSAFVGLIGDASVTTDRASNQPSGATVTCQLQVNNAVVTPGTATATGTGVQAVVQQAALVAAESDIVEICQQVQYADGSSDPSSCRTLTSAKVLPNAVRDLAESLLDPVLCPLLASLRGTYGPVAIGADGDVKVASQRVVDCPPKGPTEALADTTVRIMFALPPAP